ncbi:MetQ/NlpA family ABC transporter substrate-binding protein [Aerococcus sanguinicola]|uniref:Metal ABC transporter substrate-binding protein n=1 Tax=Aerococcus sanguinicola TaxID=119206 RepID=A0A0X8FC22_9LACT|nr:MetQ/NlpA family ABC transporter substrate-binding protein [Aerococcus sanguinicola]AMB94500.1 hypothetical protein AWM72_06930 [Aerococcus sanguinicola]
MHKFKTAVLAVLALLTLGACGSNQASQNEAAAEDSQDIRLATSPGPYSDLFLDVVKPILEEDGYKVETVEFTDLREADVALEEKAADLNIEQHTLYMENFNEEKDAHLTNIQPLPTVPMAIFPGQKDSFDSLEAGDQIGVPDDPSNLSRDLLLLEKEGLITLDPNADKANLNVEHITENPKNLKIEVISSPNLARTTPDLALAAIPGSRAFDAGIDFQTALAYEDVAPEFMLQLVVREEDKDKDWVKAVSKAYKSDQVKDAVEKINQESSQAYWILPE